jgi:hypothetical protein
MRKNKISLGLVDVHDNTEMHIIQRQYSYHDNLKKMDLDCYFHHRYHF